MIAAQRAQIKKTREDKKKMLTEITGLLHSNQAPCLSPGFNQYVINRVLFPVHPFMHQLPLLRNPSWPGVAWVTKPFVGVLLLLRTIEAWLCWNKCLYNFTEVLHFSLEQAVIKRWTTSFLIWELRWRTKTTQCLPTNNTVAEVCLHTDTICYSSSGTWNRPFCLSSRGGEEMFVT